MRVLLTGGSGQLGKAILAMAPVGLRVDAPDRTSLDLADPESILEIVRSVRPNLIINAGAYTAVDNAELESDLAHAINADAPGLLAQAIEEQGFGRLFQISTDYVFDGTQMRPYRPEDKRNPLSVYGLTKAAGEDMAGPDAIVLRTSWIYASGFPNFVRTMLRMMRTKDELRIVADQVGSPSWAPEIARVIWALAGEDQPGTYHHCDAGETSWHGFAEAIAEEALDCGLLSSIPDIKAIATSEYQTPARRPAYSTLDDSATRSFLNDTALPWRENLKRMLREEKALG